MNRDMFRQRALANRQAIENRTEKSAHLQAQMKEWVEQHIPTGILCCYVDRQPEAATSDLIRHWCGHPMINLAVPFCDGQVLTLFHLKDMDELVAGRFELLEPREELRTSARTIACHEVSLFIVPGVAFDNEGNRMGYGKGYYDRLLACADPNAQRIGYAFDEQVYDHIPNVQPWDVPMTDLLTPQGWASVPG